MVARSMAVIVVFACVHGKAALEHTHTHTKRREKKLLGHDAQR